MRIFFALLSLLLPLAVACREEKGGGAPATCDQVTCQNGGTCAVTNQQATCTCIGGFTGARCETPPEVPTSCTPNPCENGGSCSVVAGVPTCTCTGGFSGPLCATAPSVCATNPCQNGGVCYDSGGAAACHCRVSFTGALCETAAVSGIATRPTNSSCVAFDQPTSSGTLQWVPRGGGKGGLNLMMMRQSSAGYWFEAYREGDVYAVDPSGTRTVDPIVSVDVDDDGEMGLLGIALHPNFDSSPYLYVYYNRFITGGDVEVYIDRFFVEQASTSPTIDIASRKNIFTFNRDATATNHIGGTIEFDPLATNATLYFAIGDGGGGHSNCNAPVPANSENGNCKAQYMASYHGKLLRFDVSDTDATSYTPEIVGLGLRNPFRWSFDSLTGDLWLGDVGEGSFEEVNFVPRAMLPMGGAAAPINFGWPCHEGFANYASGNLCPLANELLPVHAYDHSLGVSVIGGRVYRGSAVSNAVGVYFFNDIFAPGNGPPWRLEPNPDEVPSNLEDDYERIDIGDNTDPRGFVAYTEDADGELYAMTTWGGVYRLEAASGGPPPVTVPATLSATGCFDTSGNPSAGLIPFDVRSPLWSDGASKRRWLAIPDGTSITFNAEGDFQFPNGTVLVKEFTQGGVRVETRLFVKHDNGEWAGYTYAWMNSAGVAVTDAELVGSAASTRDIPGTALDWQFPSRGQCMSCHTEQAGYSLGLELLQLNSTMAYPSGTSANQIFTLHSIGVLSSDIATLLTRDAIPKYDDTTASADARAHSYLHSNCSSCHRPQAVGFGGRSNMPDVRYRLGQSNSLATLLCDRAATAEHLGLGDGALLVEPATPGTWSDLASGGSVLYLRMAARDGVAGSSGAMPPIGSRVADTNGGLSVVGDWIETLVCP